MINAYTILQAEAPAVEVLGLVFEQYNTTDIKYKIRHPIDIPKTLFQNTFDQSTIYFNLVPFVQLQMCVDDSFINHTSHSTVERMVLQNTYY